MQFKLKPMNRSSAQAIANWRYEGRYAFYDMNKDIEDMEELLNPQSWANNYYVGTNEQDALVGFFCFEKEAEVVVVGLGMRPDCTGQGLGQGFVTAGLAFAQRKFHPTRFCLSVATFNQRAIRLYEKVGFKADGIFMGETNGGRHEFLRLVREG